MNNYAKILFEIDAIKISMENPFTYASGLRGPLYCDNRKLLTNVAEHRKIIDGLIQLSNTKRYDCLAGLATAGIPHASMMALLLSKPLCYIRSKPKEHGKGNQVEGSPVLNSRLLLIEDLVNQASSLNDAVIGARNAGFIVENCLSIVDYQTQVSQKVLAELAVSLSSLVTFSELIETAHEIGKISSADILRLKEWHHDPKEWSDKFTL